MTSPTLTPQQHAPHQSHERAGQHPHQPTLPTPWVPGLDANGFSALVDEAAALCPVSRLFAGADITIDALLEELA